MDSRIESLELEPSLPDGNCSFNAFVLGWCRPDILNKVDSLRPPGQYPSHMLSDFIKQAAIAVGAGKSWPAVKHKLLQIRMENKITLQKQMAPIFRQLSVKLARHNPVFRQRTEIHLKSAFLDYIKPIKSGVDDDIFSRHQFIRDKFAELNPLAKRSWLTLPGWSQSSVPLSDCVLVDAMNNLMSWWFAAGPNSGYDLFLRVMEKEKVWAGDIELDLLADFFDINLDVRRKNFTHHIHINYGVLERRLVTEDQVIELRYRGIVDQSEADEAVLRFLPLTEAEVDARLSAIPDVDAVRAFVLESGDALKNKRVPAEWARSLSQLIQRNIVKKQGEHYCFNCDSNTAANLLEEFPGKAQMLRWWRTNYTNKPTITLVNEDAVHWDNLCGGVVCREFDSLKNQVAVALAANACYLALLRRFDRQRFGLFAWPSALLTPVDPLMTVKFVTPEM